MNNKELEKIRDDLLYVYDKTKEAETKIMLKTVLDKLKNKLIQNESRLPF